MKKLIEGKRKKGLACIFFAKMIDHKHEIQWKGQCRNEIAEFPL